ncbi:hypothetical protein [Brevundimonas sp. FT23028]|uniref:hypothetical protein n=1 Tax=Brevundimonas sp. FT23028 TaxID=3393748 RepID=UPI003B587603
MRDPHIAIMAAHERGAGVRLSADEVRVLAFDSAITTRASVTASELGLDVYAGPDFSWAKASSAFSARTGGKQ